MSQVPAKGVRVGFTSDEDTLLVKYIATYNPTKKSRSGNALYKRLVENVDNKWNWSGTHSWQSWQTRYRKHMEEFDRRIRKYQKTKGINLEKTHETPAIGPSDQARSPPPYQGPSEAVFDVPPPFPKPANTFNNPSLPSRSDTLPVLSSQVISPVRTLPPISSQLPPSSQPLASSSQQVVTPKAPKQVLKHKSVSPIFGSLSPTHDRSAPLKTTILPKVVKGHFTTALTDRLGRVRLGSRSEKQTMAWPPEDKEVAQRPTALTSEAPLMRLPNGLRVRHEPELSDVRRTRSVSPPWNADEGMTPLSGNLEVHQTLERRLDKRGMRKRVAQSLR